MKSDHRSDGVSLILADRELLDDIPKLFRFTALDKQPAGDRRGCEAQHVRIAGHGGNSAPPRRFQPQLRALDLSRIERDGKREPGVEEDIVVDGIANLPPVVLDLKPHHVREGLADTDFEEVRAARRDGQRSFDIIETEARRGAAQEQVLHRRGLENAVVGSIELQGRCREIVACRQAGTYGSVLDQETVVVEPNAKACRKVSGPNMILDEQACIRVSFPASEINIELGKFVGFGRQEALSDPAHAQVPTDLQRVEFLFEGEVTGEGSFSKAPVLQDENRS